MSNLFNSETGSIAGSKRWSKKKQRQERARLMNENRWGNKVQTPLATPEPPTAPTSPENPATKATPIPSTSEPKPSPSVPTDIPSIWADTLRRLEEESDEESEEDTLTIRTDTSLPDLPPPKTQLQKKAEKKRENIQFLNKFNGKNYSKRTAKFAKTLKKCIE